MLLQYADVSEGAGAATDYVYYRSYCNMKLM